MRLIFATNNFHKMNEIRDILDDKYRSFVYSLDDLGVSVNPEETGKSFEENADIKSKATYYTLVKDDLLRKDDFVIADDTGLCIDFFDGAPGIYSARFMGNISQAEKNEKILYEMKDIPDEKRTAHFETYLSVIIANECLLNDNKYTDTPKTHIFKGYVRGFIAKTKDGDEGFGYDPIFAVGSIDNLINDKVFTYSKLGQKEKNKISHRACALSSFISYLEKSHNM